MSGLYYPSLLTNQNAFPAHIMFTFYERDSTVASSMKEIIHLYMPEHFGQPNTVQWDSSFKAGEALAGVVAGVAKPLMDRIGNSRLGKIVHGAQNLGNAAGDLGELAAGKMLNPYISQLFRGVNFRNFTYTFRFVPFSPGDCGTIKEIIKIFRKYALPSAGGRGSMNPYLNYPGEVEIKYIFCGKDNEWIHKFKRSVITNIEIDYTGAGMWTMLRNRISN